jgi:hypothetical protein
MKKAAAVVTLALGVLLGATPSAFALSFTLNATGTITDAASPLALNDPFSLTIQYDTAALDAFPGDPTYGLFPAITALSFTSGSFSATASGGRVLVNDANDYVQFLTTATEGLTGGAIGGWPLGLFWVQFGGLPVTSDLLTSLTTDLLMQMPSRQVSLFSCETYISNPPFGATCSGGAQALGTISSASLEPSAVPEPTSMLLFGTGAGVLAIRRRRRQQ